MIKMVFTLNMNNSIKTSREIELETALKIAVEVLKQVKICSRHTDFELDVSNDIKLLNDIINKG